MDVFLYKRIFSLSIFVGVAADKVWTLIYVGTVPNPYSLLTSANFFMLLPYEVRRIQAVRVLFRK